MDANATRRVGRVLLIDDDEDDVFFHTRALRAALSDVEIDVAGDADQAMAMLDGNSHSDPDLILLDLNMPRRSGWEFVTDYDRLPSGRRAAMTLVVLTSSEAPEDRQRGTASPHVAAYLTKPLTPEAVTRLVEQLFS